jgi:hypothetical protein
VSRRCQCQYWREPPSGSVCRFNMFSVPCAEGEGVRYLCHRSTHHPPTVTAGPRCKLYHRRCERRR